MWKCGCVQSKHQARAKEGKIHDSHVLKLEMFFLSTIPFYVRQSSLSTSYSSLPLHLYYSISVHNSKYLESILSTHKKSQNYEYICHSIFRRSSCTIRRVARCVAHRDDESMPIPCHI